MDKSIIQELIQRKRNGFKNLADYIKVRIQDLDNQSENVSLGIHTENSTYCKFIGRNVRIKISGSLFTESIFNIEDTSLKESLSIARQSLRESFMIFDGDDRIPDLIYNNISDRGVNEISLIKEFLKTTWINRCKSREGELERTKIFINNALNDKHTNYSEIKDKNLCACLEFSVLLHNIFQILGYNSQILFGLIDSNEVIGLHTYNILDFSQTRGVRLLIDLSNPYFIDGNGEQKIEVPIAVLTNLEYEELINGKKIYKDMAEFSNRAFHANLKSRYSTYGLRISQADKKKIMERNQKIVNSHQNKDDKLKS